MKKRTSIHTLNGDAPLSAYERKLYFILNYINNSIPSFSKHNYNIRRFESNNIKNYWNKIFTKRSPSRKLSDLFWLELPWTNIKKELQNINVFDTGCGNGNYGVKLSEFSNNLINSYSGIDIKVSENWDDIKKQYPTFRFHQFNGKDISEYIPSETNFIMTQSAIEHFEEDLLYFEQIRNYILSYGKSVIQIHLLPSKACLKLYLYHGVRQYTHRTILEITRLFSGFSNCTLFELGGDECNKLHHDFITKPLLKDKVGDLRDLKTEKYDEKLLSAIKKDMDSHSCTPAFYALLIHSNPTNRLF